MKTSIYLLLMVISCFLFSCMRPFKIEEVQGKYGWCNENKRDTIIIYPNGTYIHKQVTSDTVFLANSTWHYDLLWNEMVFNEFSFILDKRSGEKIPIYQWGPRLRIENDGEVKLIYSSEDNLYYSKK